MRRTARQHVQCVYCGGNHLPAECHDPRSRPCGNCGRFGHDTSQCRLPRRMPYQQPYAPLPYQPYRPPMYGRPILGRAAPLALPAPPEEPRPTAQRTDINPTGIPRPPGPIITHPPSSAAVHYVEEPIEDETYVDPYVSYDEEGNPFLMDYRPIPVMALGCGRGRGLGGNHIQEPIEYWTCGHPGHVSSRCPKKNNKQVV